MSKQKSYALPFIHAEPFTNVVVIFSMIVSALLFVFALNYGDIILSVASLFQIFLVVVGDKISIYSGTAFTDKKESLKRFDKDFTLSLVAIFFFLLLDVGVPLTLRVPLSTAAVPSSLVPTISFVYLVNQSVGEEKLFRGGITNLFLKWSRNMVIAVIASGFIFGIYHIPAEQGQWINLAIVSLSGMVVAVVDIFSGHEITSIAAHAINNGLSAIYASVIGINLATFQGIVQVHLILKLIGG